MNQSANLVLAAERQEKEQALKELQVLKDDNTEMDKAIEDLMKDQDKASDEYRALTRKFSKLEVKNATKVADLEAKNKDLRAKIKAEIKDHEYEKKGQQATRERCKKWETETETLKTKNKMLEENNRSLREEVRVLRIENTASRSNVTIAQQGYNREIDGLRLQVQNLEVQAGKDFETNRTQRSVYNDLVLRIRRVVAKEMIATKGRTTIQDRLDNALIHFENQDQYQVLREIDRLLQQMAEFPIRLTIQEFEIHTNGILRNPAYTVPVQAAARPNAGVGVILNGHLPRPTNMFPANPLNQGLRPDAQRDAKKRKIDDANN